MGDREAKLVGAGRHVDEVDEVLEALGDAAALLDVVAAVEEFRAAHAQLDGKAGACGLANRGEYLAGEAQAVFEGAAVLVGAPVEVRREELVDKPAVPRVDHAHLEARAARQHGGVGVGGDDVLDLLDGKRSHGEPIRTHAIARPPLTQVGFLLLINHISARVLARMRQLDGGDGAVTLDGVGDVGKRAELPGRGKRKVQHLRAVGLGMDHELAHGDRGGTTLGAGLVEALGAQAGRTLGRDVGGTHGSRYHAVAKCQVAHLEGFAEIGVIALHGSLPDRHVLLG